MEFLDMQPQFPSVKIYFIMAPVLSLVERNISICGIDQLLKSKVVCLFFQLTRPIVYWSSQINTFPYCPAINQSG